MKNSKRLEKLETDTKKTPVDHLIALGLKWKSAVNAGNYGKATAYRQKAEKYLNEMPEYREKPPVMPHKMLFIDWQWFIHWTNKDWRKGYQKAVENNRFPARPVKE